MLNRHLTQTLDDLACVPSGLFYIGFDNPSDELTNTKILKELIL